MIPHEDPFRIRSNHAPRYSSPGRYSPPELGAGGPSHGRTLPSPPSGCESGSYARGEQSSLTHRKVTGISRRALVAGSAFAWVLNSLSPTEAAPEPLTIAAASDLQGAFNELGPLFEKATGTTVVFSFGSTGNLARQIENGAPFDAFFAANESFVVDLERKGRIVASSRRLYALGVLVLASSRRAGVEVRDLKGLLDPRVKRVALANPDHAPYGAAAREALRAAGIWDALQPKLVLAENVRQAYQFVESGNTEAGMLARSMSAGPQLWRHAVSARLHAPLRQAAGIVKGSRQEAAARAFLARVLSKEGQALLQRHGFQPPPKSLPSAPGKRVP